MSKIYKNTNVYRFYRFYIIRIFNNLWTIMKNLFSSKYSMCGNTSVSCRSYVCLVYTNYEFVYYNHCFAGFYMVCLRNERIYDLSNHIHDRRGCVIQKELFTFFRLVKWKRVNFIFFLPNICVSVCYEFSISQRKDMVSSSIVLQFVYKYKPQQKL
jgi:hypothetical protein